MGELGRIKFSLFVMLLLLQFAEPAQLLLYHTVRDGDEATLSCESVRTDQSNCDGTTWSFKSSRRDEVDLVERGQKVGDRLSLTENCSLVIKEVRAEDAGRYFCKQYKSGREQKPSGVVSLSVVSMTEQRINDQVTLNCTVTTPGRCTQQPVKWLLKGQTVDKHNNDIKLSESSCFASVTFLTTYFLFSDSSWPSVFGCKVTDGAGTKLFPFHPPPSGDKPANETTTTPHGTSSESNKQTEEDKEDKEGEEGQWWPFIIAAVVVAAVLVAAVMVIRWRKAKGNKTRMNVGQATPAAPGSNPDTADPEDGVSYASVTYTNKTSGKAQILSQNVGQGDDAVTYATVKTSSADPNNLYATVK
ncbi:uncharacterized protein V6R79_024793 [Siganus canaliculatus]